MHLKILLPDQVYADLNGVTRMVAETSTGSFGILPRRLDCVAAIVPGIIMYAIGTETETYVAVDQGMLVKTGPDVLISVRRAIGGKDLGQLHALMQQEFQTLNENEKNARAATEKLESGFMSRFARVQHE